MARPTSPLRVSQFLGYDDDLPISIGESEASALENYYRVGKSLVRRAGQSALGSANLSPDAELRMLQWFKLGSSEHLLGVVNCDLVDFLDSSVGATVGNGADRFCNGEASGYDCNAAWIDGIVTIGNGLDQNIAYNGLAGTSDQAAQFTAASTQFLSHTVPGVGSAFTMGDYDFTIAAWVYLDSKATSRPIASIYDTTTASFRTFRLYYDSGDNRFEFGMRNDAGAGFEGNVHADALGVPSTATWYFVVGQYDAAADQMRISVNAGTQTVVAGPAGGTNVASADLRIGAYYTSPTTSSVYMDGRIARVGFWKTAAGGSGAGALTTTQITTLYNSGRGLAYASLPASVTPGLVGYWNMTETTGTRNDSVSTNNLTASASSPTSANGVDYAIAAYQAMVDPGGLAGSFVTVADGGAAGSPNGTYTYKFTFLSYAGHPGEPTNASPSITVVSRKIQLSSIPLHPAGEDCSGRQIYRLNPGETEYKLIATLSDNTTTSYLDNIADASATTTLVVGNTRFPPCRYLVEHQNRMIGAHSEELNVGDLQTVYISNVREPYYCPESPDLEDPNQGTRAALQGRAAGEIMGLCSHGGVVAVFTGATGHLLLGVEPNDFRLQKFCDHGTTAHRTIVSVRSLLLWLAPDGVYQWDGQHTVRISEDVRATLEAMTATEMAKAHAVVWRDRYYLFWPTGCLWYDLNFRIWGKLTNNTWRTSTVTTYTSTALQRIYASYYGHSRVYQLETGATDSVPTTNTVIAARWASRDWDMGLAARDKRVHYVEVKFKKGTGTATVTLYRGTGESVQTISQNIATVDNASDTVCRSLTGAVEQARDEHFRLDITCSTTAAELILLAAGLHWTLAT